MITVDTDRMIADLTEKLGQDFADLDLDALFKERDDVANHYMLYAVKPLPEVHDRRPHAVAIRARRTELLAELWLHLDRLCDERGR